jgi:hypothetical protein
MNKEHWRKNLDKELNKSISTVIKETKKYSKQIESAKDPGKAQIWVALGLLQQKIEEITPKNTKKKTEKKLSKKEVDSIIKTLETL